jgi:Tfp pilus assembly protein PilF
VDQTRFREAQEAYEAGEFRVAAKGFLASASRGPEGNGAAYHMAGNSLMRLRRHQDAVTVYGHALRDPLYDRRGSVWANLGAAYVELGDYAQAFKSYESAIEEADFTTPYKAYQGMANALLERGRVEDAGIAYRKAALDPGNPDPGKALVNLGLCFMALGRPEDAVEAYRAALGFDQYMGRGKALANIGQAHVALGQYEEAVKAFEKSTQLHSYKLSPSASAAYATALEQLKGRAENRDDSFDTSVEIDELLPGQSTTIGQPPEVATTLSETTIGWDSGPLAATEPAVISADIAPASLAEEVQHQMTEPLAPLAPPDPTGSGPAVEFGDDQSVADFFSVTEEELKARGREASRAERHAKGPHAMWRSLAFILIAIVVAFGVLVAAYQAGYGWPTQQQTVVGMMGAYQAGSSVDGYWVAAPTRDISKEMAKIPPVKSYAIDSVALGATTSVAAITVTPKAGAALHYTITLSREGVGWKVIGIDNDWRTSGG